MAESDLTIEQRWASHPRNVQHARELVRRFIMRYALDQADLIELAVGEACANAVEHGSPAGVHSHFVCRCTFLTNPCELIFEVEDEGQEFALTNLTLSHIPDLYSEGGRGLFLINQIMDEVGLQRTPNGLTVRMVKHVACPQRAGLEPRAASMCR